MFRAKIALTFVVLVSILLGATYLIMNSTISDALEEDAAIALRRAATIAEQSRRIDEFALLEKAEYSARKLDLHRYMLLTENPEVAEQVNQEIAQTDKPIELRHLKVHQLLERDRFIFQDIAKSQEGTRNIARGLLEREPVVTDMFMALDKSGKGVAALGKDRYSWFGQNVMENHPIVAKVLEEEKQAVDLWQFRWEEGAEPQMYRVALAPIKPAPNMEPAGVVVVGSLVDDSVANRSQRLLTGVTTPEGETDDVGRAVIERAPELAFFRGKDIYASTLAPEEQAALEEALFTQKKVLDSDNPEELLDLQIGATSYMGMVRFFADQYGKKDQPGGFVVMTNLTEARAPVDNAMTNIFLIGGAVLIIGLILLLYFIYSFLKPIEQVEQGIGEVLAGNKDYTFEVEGKHEIASSLAQGLNLMSAFLQGKPMPDADDDLGGWGELIGDSGGSEPKGGGKITGVQMPGMGPKNDDES